MTTVGIADVDLLAGHQYRFPNLAAMKLSAYHKLQGDTTTLLPDYRHLTDFDKIFLCCVFTEAAKTVPKVVFDMPHIQRGGTGFFFDKAPQLPSSIEHTTPDYALYHHWAKNQTGNVEYYSNVSIGFLSRGCFRRCPFCINRHSKRAVEASPLHEFYDASNERVCLLDDNILAFRGHLSLIENLVDTCKKDRVKFEFKQGIDIRLLKPPVASLLCSSTHFGEIIFAFDSIRDAKSVRRGLKVLRKQAPSKGAKAYVLCGFDSQGWQDIATVFQRLQILWEYGCLGYVMRHEDHKKASPLYRGLYTSIAAWANQPQFQRAVSFRQFCKTAGGKAMRRMQTFERAHPNLAKAYFNLTYYSVVKTAARHG